MKDLTCINPGCNGDITKNIEVRYCASFDEMMVKAEELHREYYQWKDYFIWIGGIEMFIEIDATYTVELSEEEVKLVKGYI